VAERKILSDAIDVGGVHDGGFAEGAAAFGPFALEQVAPARAGAKHFAGGGDFESLGHGLFGFDAFWTSHKIFSVSL
jgi:hypothetical protein